MKNRLAFIFKIFMIIALIAFIGVAIFAGVVWARWPWWVGLFIAAGIFGVFLAILFFKKLMLKKKEQKFVSQIIEQDTEALGAADKDQKEVSKEMQEKWKAAINSLKKSHLKRLGNPLYVLPWYMIIGKSGSGKTTAIKSAKLSSSFSEVNSVSGISGTRNCDWWFFEQAILIDTAGRYAVRVDEDRDRDEWQRFLELLSRYRKKEPLNGLVVTIAADYLQETSAEGLEAYGQDIRKRIDELMRVLGAKFPVYVMVTKCDLVQGMTQFSDSFSEDALGQSMGMINQNLENDAQGLVAKCFSSMGERIRDIRLLLLQKMKGSSVSPELILFPREFERLKPGFEAFSKGVFQENPYQETPFFRGIFFSSGRQEGSPFSHFMKDLGLISEKEVLPGTNRGLFLHDFFSRLLPSDRGLFKMTQRSAAWQRLTRNIGFAAWTAIIIALCGILSFSFVKNLHTVKTASVQFSDPQLMKGELVSDVIALEQFRTTIQMFEQRNSQWWIPRLGLNESIRVEAELKDKYCALMEKRFIDPFDKKMADNMAYFKLTTPVEIFIRHADHLVRRVNLMKAKLSNEPMDVLQTMDQPAFNTVETGADAVIAEEVLLKMKEQYLYYLIWQDDSQDMNRRMNELQQWLARILSIPDANLNWLVTKANSDPLLKAVTLADFWGKSIQEIKARTVSPGFTLKGKETIDGFITDIEAALTDPLIMAGKKRDFYKWYEKAYMAEWYNFTAEFTRGRQTLETREQWLNLSANAWKKSGPYFSVLDTIANQLAPFLGNKEQPEWTSLVMELNNLHAQSAALKAKESGSAGVIGKAASSVKSKIANVTGGRNITSGLDTETMMKAAKLFLTYQDALASLGPAVSSRRAAFDLATEIYSEDPATSSIAFFKAQQALKRLKNLVGYPGKQPGYVWKILGGPLDFFQELTVREASCQLQKKWEEMVLMEVKDASTSNLNSLLLGPEGLVTKFVKGPGKPFIKRDLKQGFYPAAVNGRALPFHKSFLSFLSKGVRAARPMEKSYNVTVSTYPTNANDDAQVQPHATVLELVCSNGTTKLENLNFPARKVFAWSPGSECEVVFTIKIGSLSLVKKYQNPFSFPKFFRDFSNGTLRVTPADFPDQQNDLKRIGVKFIKAKYQFKGSKPVAGLLRSAPGRTPREITRCWE